MCSLSGNFLMTFISIIHLFYMTKSSDRLAYYAHLLQPRWLITLVKFVYFTTCCFSYYGVGDVIELEFKLQLLQFGICKRGLQFKILPSFSALACFMSSNLDSSNAGQSSFCSHYNKRHSQRPGLLHSSVSTSQAMVASVQDLFDFICTGPLMGKLGLTLEIVAESIDRWLEYGSYLCRLFGMNELDLSISEKIRIYHYYIPVFVWCQMEILAHKSKFKGGEQVPPLVIGISAPQGSGKTTLVFALDYLFRVTGRNSATLSIDDFYLKSEDQAKLHSENPGNSLLELRGNAGSHDLPFSVETLKALCNLTKEGQSMKLPRYNKSAYDGRGDRADVSTWPEVNGPLAVVLFEGWMLGFKTLPLDVVKAVDPQLEVVNRNLEAYYDAWDKFVMSWIIIKIKNPECVYQWRLEAEIAMRAAGKPGMSDEEVLDFVSRYMPAYKAYLPTLYSEGPRGVDNDHLLVVEIDEDRNPISQQ